MGNFSRADTFDRLKHYVSVRLQQGVPILDTDWNELQDIRQHELETFLKWFVGDGVPLGNDGFRVGDDGADNDFTLADGRCLVEGREAVNDHAEQNAGTALRYTTQPLFGDGVLATAWGVDPLPALTTPGAARTDTVYLDVWEREVGATEDADIVNPAIGIETSVRTRREWVVRVAEGTAVPAAAAGHVHYPLATLARSAADPGIGTVVDLRSTGLGLASVKERTDNLEERADDLEAQANALEAQTNALETQANGLEASKVNRAGDTLSGDLVATGRLESDFTPTAGNGVAITADAVSGAAVDKVGVQATADGSGGNKHGVYGLASGNDSGTKYGVYGVGTGSTGDQYGLYGSAGGGGVTTGVYGVASGTGTKYGARAEVVKDDTATKYGLYTLVDGAGGLKYGLQTTVTGSGGTQYGGRVSSSCDDSSTHYGLYSTASSANGVKYGLYSSASGAGGTKYGVYGRTSGDNGSRYGVYGYSTGTSSSSTYGVYGYAHGNGTGNKYGVRAYAYGTSGTKYAIYATTGGSGTRYAGYFSGNVHVTGTLSKGSGTFLIDHVLDPENKILRHSFVESPEDLCLYRGKVTLDSAGTASVDMPDYFAALTLEEEATVLLTPIGEQSFLTSYTWQRSHTRLVIHGEAGAEVSYLVLANRDDPVIRLMRRPVEEDKAAAGYEPGKYINPEAYGQPPEEEPGPEEPEGSVDEAEEQRLAAEAVEEHKRVRQAARDTEQRLAERTRQKGDKKGKS